MPWTLDYRGGQIRFNRQLRNLNGSEEDKYDRWLGRVPDEGPFDAAESEFIRCTPLSGSTSMYHLYLGRYQRLFFTVENETVRLEHIGHTR